MPRTTASWRWPSVAASFLNGSNRQRLVQLSQALRSSAACSGLLCASGPVQRRFNACPAPIQRPFSG